MSLIIDRRKLENNIYVSVQRFISKIKRVSQDEIQKDLRGKLTLKYVNFDQGGFWFNHDSGIHNYITTGNDKWMRDDIIERDLWEEFLEMLMGDQGDDGDDENEDGLGFGTGGGGEDIFTWTDEESWYLQGLFENLRLPNLTKKSIESKEKEIVRNGYSLNGSNIDLMKTFVNSIGRRMALKAPLEEKLEILKKKKTSKKILQALEDEIKSIAFIDDMDIRYRRFEEVITPSKRMVMFLILDVSGSMGQEEKNLAKLFSKLVVTFLAKQYTQCEIEYIIFHDKAKSVDYQNFFYGKESGGTTFHPALELEMQIIKEKYSKDWNIYTMAFSDTDFFGDDIPQSRKILLDLVPLNQYFMYVNIYDAYVDKLVLLVTGLDSYTNFTSSIVNDEQEILEEFARIFKE